MVLRNTPKDFSRQVLPIYCRLSGSLTTTTKDLALQNGSKSRFISNYGLNEFQLTEPSGKSENEEKELYTGQIRNIKDWWDTPRFAGIRRPYSAEDVACKRGTLEQSYPSSLMAKKLYNLLEKRAASHEPVHTSALSRNSKRRQMIGRLN